MATKSIVAPQFPASTAVETVPLSAMHAGEQGVVVRLSGGRCMLSRMASLGFTPGAEICIVQNFGRGPLIARVRDARIALGRGEADKIYVKR
ncbi:MAG: ferrous iron transport protein A [Anaerolineae bacterium]|nr:ferrous iron transport protein A [Anaerolineae bacterium]